METSDKILAELKTIRSILEARQTQTPRRQMMKIPEAAKILGISALTLRRLIGTGEIPARCINPEAKNKHYILDIDDAIAHMRSL